VVVLDLLIVVKDLDTKTTGLLKHARFYPSLWRVSIMCGVDINH
jgi:hypothetical protein